MSRPRVLAAGWTLLILLSCSIPGADLPDVDVTWIDKVVHAALFAGFSVFWLRVKDDRRATLLVVAAGMAYGVFTEVYQGWLPWERMPDPYDALADGVGVLLGVWGHRWSRRRFADAE